jgi:hypothetical protein
MLFGAIPAWQASRVSIVSLLKDSSATATPARRAWRSALLVSQIACIGVLLVVSTLFVASFIHVMRADLGIDRSNLLGVSTLGFRGRVDEIQGRIAQLPGVTGVAGVTNSSLPLVGPAFGGAYDDTKLRPEGTAEAAAVEMQMYRVTPNYFEVTGTALRRGSTWRSDSEGLKPVVIDELAARRLFGDREPIGSRVIGTNTNDIFTIVGVAPVLLWRGPDETARPTTYFPLMANAKANTGDSSYAPLCHRRRSCTASKPRWRRLHRLALGATADDIGRRVLFTTGRYVLLGLALGLPAAWWVSRGFRTLFFQVQPGDLSTYVIVALIIILAALVAAIVPARRASRVDPLVSLRAA